MVLPSACEYGYGDESPDSTGILQASPKALGLEFVLRTTLTFKIHLDQSNKTVQNEIIVAKCPVILAHVPD